MRIRIRVVAALAGLVVLAGCGGSDGEAADQPKASATPAALTLDDLAAALPRSSQVAGGDKKVYSCPGRDACKADTASVGISLEPSLTSDEVYAEYGAYVLPEDVSVTARVSKDAGAATGKVRRALAKEEKDFGGTFSTRGTKNSRGYVFGQRGTGRAETVTVSGWSGFLAHRELVLTNPEGETDSGPVARTELHLSRGAVSVQVLANVLHDDPSDIEASESLARDVFEAYVARLG